MSLSLRIVTILMPFLFGSLQLMAADIPFCEADPELCSKGLRGSDVSVSGGPTSNNKVSKTLSCISKAKKMLNDCEDQYSTTATSCDSDQDSGMNSAIDMAANIGNILGQNASSSVVAACSKMGTLSQAASAAVTAYRYNCMSNVSSCRSACSEVQIFLKENNYCSTTTGEISSGQAAEMNERARDTNKMCGSFDDKVAQAQNAMSNLAQTTLNSTQCAALASGTSMADLCKSNPALIGCSALTNVDCSDPTMASNRVCVCSANPLDPSCNNALAGNSNPNALNNGWIGGATPTANADGLNLSGGDLGGLPGIEPGSRGSGGDSAVDGKQGGGAGLGGGGGGGGLASDGTGGRGGGGAGMPQVTAGFYGGGGSGSFGSSSRYGGASGGGGGVGAEGKPGAPNLRQFLPGGKYDPKFRGLAGMTGPDGITGPNSNIWQKVQNRYRVMSPSLLP